MEITFNLFGTMLLLAYIIGIWASRSILQQSIGDMSILDKDDSSVSDKKDNAHNRRQGVIRAWVIIVWPVYTLVDMALYVISLLIISLTEMIKAATVAWNKKKAKNVSTESEDK